MRPDRWVAMCAVTGGLWACGEKIDPVQAFDLAAVPDAPAGAVVSWCREVRPILEQWCTGCHASSRTGAGRSGAPAGVDYDTYALASANADRGLARLQARSMPPGGSVPQGEIRTVALWIDQGKADCPPPGGDHLPPGGHTGQGDPGPEIPAVACSTGAYWTEGDDGKPEMHPGRNCIACHDQRRAPGEDDPPRFAMAGTVMGAFRDVDDCIGVPGVTVEITDAASAITTYRTNSSGNFLAAAAFRPALPYTARLVLDGRERRMATPQSNLNCMDCHTREGRNGAPGRIVAP